MISYRLILRESMAHVDEYLRLKEMDALLTQAKRDSIALDEELNRLKRREGEKAERQIQLNTLQTEYKELAHQIAEVDRQLSQRLSPETITKLEETGLNYLIRQQELEELMQEHQTFLAGFEETLNELREEIQAAMKQHTLLRDQNIERAKLLEQELSPDWQRAYRKIVSQNPAHGPFSRIDNGHCAFCRGTVSKLLESEVEAQLLLKPCPSCGRLFLPHKAVYG